MANLDVTSLLQCPQLRIVGGVTVERRLPSQPNAFGETRTQVATEVTIDPVVIHNASGKDLLRVPEADRAVETIAGYCEQIVYTGDTGLEPDIIQYQGRRWRVNSVQDYDIQGGVYLWTAALIPSGAR